MTIKRKPLQKLPTSTSNNLRILKLYPIGIVCNIFMDKMKTNNRTSFYVVI